MVHGKVQTGRYNSASEVVREALRLMEERDRVKAMHRDELRKKIASGLTSLEEGRFSDGEEFFAQMDAAFDEEICAKEKMVAAQQGEQHQVGQARNGQE